MYVVATQTLTHAILNFTTLSILPQAFTRLNEDHILITRINMDTLQHTLRHKILWPGNVTITKKGNVVLVFAKKTEKQWKEPVVKLLHGIMYNEPRYWDAEIVSNKELANNTCLVELKMADPVYNFFGIGRRIRVRNDSVPCRRGRNEFIPVIIPGAEKKLSEFYPGIDKFRSSSETFSIIVRFYENDHFGKYICHKSVGSLLGISAPIGVFDPSYFINVEKVIFLVGGIGIANVLSILTYILQENRIPVVLLYNAQYENLIFFRELLEKFEELSDKFELKIYVNKPSRNWKGFTNWGSFNVIKDIGIPVRNGTRKKNENFYFVLSGGVEFVMRVSKTLKNRRKFNVPRNKMFRYV